MARKEEGGESIPVVQGPFNECLMGTQRGCNECLMSECESGASRGGRLEWLCEEGDGPGVQDEGTHSYHSLPPSHHYIYLPHRTRNLL